LTPLHEAVIVAIPAVVDVIVVTAAPLAVFTDD
jgi:hypothetical protein